MKITTSKIIIGISIMTITIVMMIINADISANVKAFALILTVPVSIATTMLLLAEEAEKEFDEMMINEIAAQPRVTPDIKRIDSNDFNILFIPEENFDIDTENNIETYVNEWVDLLDLRMICTAPVVKTCDIDGQVNEIHESLSKMARDADKRIAELCKIGGDKK